MFAPRDEKAKFRVGTKVTYDYKAGVFKVTRRDWDANGALNYTIEGDTGRVTYVRQKDLEKVVH